MILLNTLKSADIIFFIVCVVIILIIIGIYFLIPVINKKQYEEARENLRKREKAFKGNLKVEREDTGNKEKNE